MQVIIPSGHSNYADFVVPVARFHAAIAAEWACPQRCQVRPPPPRACCACCARLQQIMQTACPPASKDCGFAAQRLRTSDSPLPSLLV